MMKFKQMIFWLTVLLVYIMATRISVDTDTWWHLRAGKWMLENRQILTVDLFSYTRYGARWLYPGWLIEIPMAFIESTMGLGGLNIFCGFIIAMTFAFMYVTTRGNEILRAFLIILAAIASGIYWSARPHLMTLLFLAVYLYLFENGARRGYTHYRRVLWIALPIVMLCWVNMHGGFIVGFLIWGIYLVELVSRKVIQAILEKRSIWEALRHQDIGTLVIAGIEMGILANLNPLGYRIFLYPFQTVSIQKLGQYIQEWQSPDFHSISMQPFIWLLILLLCVSAFSRKRWIIRDVFLVSIFLYMALMASRNIALFALVAPLPIARVAEGISAEVVFTVSQTRNIMTFTRGPSKDYPKLNLFILGMLFLGCVYRSLMVYPENIVFKELNQSYPTGAVNFLKENRPQGRLFNSYNWGAYLLWSLPEYPVFVDGRTDLYSDEILNQWFQIAQMQEGWEYVIERWKIRVILMEKDWAVAKFLQQNGWCQIYRDDVALILVKCP